MNSMNGIKPSQINVVRLNEPVEPKNPKLLKTLLTVGAALSAVSVIIATLIIAALIDKNDPSEVHAQYNYILLLFTPIPLATIITSIVFFIKRYTIKTVVYNTVAVTALAIMLVFGLSGFFISEMYEHDYAYLTEMSQTVDIVMPENGTISTRRITTDDAPPLGVTVKAASGIKFTDEAEIDAFIQRLASDGRWRNVSDVSEDAEFIESYLPDFLELDTSENARWMFYNKTEGLFNEMSNTPGNAELWVFEFNEENGTMRIWEVYYTIYESEVKKPVTPKPPQR